MSNQVNVYFKTEAEALKRYKDRCEVSETVSKPFPVRLIDNKTGEEFDGWAVSVRFWSLD